MNVLITRPRDDSASLADALRRIGIESVSEPLLAIRPIEGPPLDLADTQALLATSANGVRALAGRSERRDLPLFAVGDATARAAREIGFTDVQSAEGDVGTLVALVRDRSAPAKGALVHAAGREVAGDLGKQLEAAGFTYRREVIYEADTVGSLSPAAVAAIKDGRIDAALVYSPRTAETLGRLVRKARLVRDCRNVELWCLSQAVADAVGDIPWKTVRVAEAPTQEAMLALAEARMQSGAGASSASVAAVPARRRRGGTVRTVVATLVVVAILAAAVWASAPWWRPELARYVPALAAPEAPTARIDSLSERLTALESTARAPAAASADELAQLQAERAQLQAQLATTMERLDKLERAVAAVRDSAAKVSESSDPAAAREALKQVGERLAEVDRARASAASEAAARIETLARQIETLEKVVPSQTDAETVRQARLVFAIGRLRDAVLSTRPYAIELSALGTLAVDDPAIAQAIQTLATHADGGVPSVDSLRQRFSAVAREAVNATRIPLGDGWWERSLATVMRAINVRRTDDVEGSDVEAIIARAERAIARSDVRQTAQEMRALPENVAPVAQRWLADAEAYVAANRALVDLQARAFAALGVERAK